MIKTKTPVLAAAICVAAAAQATPFTIEWTNHGPQPLSPLFWSVGNTNFDIFQVGGSASVGIKNIAETGNVDPMLGLAAAAGSDLQVFGVLAGGPLMPGLTRTGTFDADPGDDWFSFATMLGQTNDGFLGESVSSMGLRLFNGSVPLGFSVNIYGARAWDAGTEQNTQDAADLAFLGGMGNPADSNGAIRVHASVLPNVGDSWQQMPDWAFDTQLMTLTILPVPEPGVLTALGLGALALARRRRRRSS